METQVRNSHGLPIKNYEEKQSNDTRNMTNANFVPKGVQRLLSSHKISEKYNEQVVFYK